MTVLSSPIPHPLDYCPWQLPGWVYEALDWVVGVEWPEGNEKAVWDLADQWYGVAATLAGPRADAITAAGEVRSGYGAVGAVAEAFDTAWKKVADGDEAPLPLLLAVSTDLGRLVEECGCDIEGAKLEVWIELGILVVELLGMAIAVVLTAGAASPAAAAAITATRFIVQQIFRKLIAQLARKTLKKGMQEATERAAKQVTRDGLRGLGRNALRGGLLEAAEEGGVNLAVQGYQNSTGRRDGLDLADLATSAVGGFAGGAAAPLAGLGRHATSPGGRIAENFGREMGGEVIAEQAASLATGGGFIGVEDAARAAASGATGSAVSQSDAALQARLDGRLSALAGTTLDPSPTPTAPTESRPAPPVPMSDATAPAIPGQRAPSDPDGTEGDPSAQVPRPSKVSNSPGPVPVEPWGTANGSVETSVSTGPRTDAAPRPISADPVAATSQPISTLSATSAPVPAVTVTPSLSAVAVDPVLAASPVTTSAPVDLSPAAPNGATPTTASTVTTGTAPGMTTMPSPAVSSAPTPAPVPTAAPGPSPTMASGPAPTVTTTPAMTGVPAPPVTTSTLAVAPSPAVTSGPPSTLPNTVPTTGNPSPSLPAQPGWIGVAARTTPARPDPSPINDLSLLEVLAPNTQSQANAKSAPAPGPSPQPPTDPAPRTPEWYEARWAEDREALERRRYQGYFNSQRAWFEDRRREEEVTRLRALAEEHILKASEYADQAIRLRREGKRDLAKLWHEAAVEEERACHRRRDLAEEIRDGRVVPNLTIVETDAHFQRINDDVAELAVGGVETGHRSALTGDDSPPSSDQTRPYGERGGLRPPLALHQTDLERQMPREPDGSVTRTADPRKGRWFSLVNDGGPSADATRSINCLDCTLSLYETWLHGRPRVSAPRTFDGYLGGDVNRPINGEAGGPGRVESVTGGVYQSVASTQGMTPAGARQQVMQGYADLHRQLLSGGHGSFAFLINTWEGGGAHAWVALNQNGTVLYLDPQVGTVSDRPPYFHRGVPHAANVTSIEALVVGPTGKPMPMPGRVLGDFSAQWSNPNPDQPDSGTAGPHVSPPHLLGAPGQMPGAIDPADPDHKAREPEPEEVRQTRDRTQQERFTAGVTVPSAMATAPNLDAVFAAGVSPGELAAELDPATLRRLAPHLDQKDAHELTTLFAEPRVQQMLQDTWRTPPQGEPLLAETLVRQLIQRPDLVQLLLATPELMASLTARPLTLHHLASHQQAIGVLGAVLDDVAERGKVVLAAEPVPSPAATPLTAEQLAISASIKPSAKMVRQPGFDMRKRGDVEYRRQYLDSLYVAAAQAQKDLTDLALRLARDGADGAGKAGWRKRPKDRRRAEDKVVKYGGEVSRLLDLAGAKVEFDSIDGIYRALARLRDEPTVQVVEFNDRFQNPQDSGYRDIQLQLRMSNGHIAEFRLHLAALDRVAEWEHALFEVRRDIDALAKEQARELSAAERAIRDGILRREQELFWHAMSSTMKGGQA